MADFGLFTDLPFMPKSAARRDRRELDAEPLVAFIAAAFMTTGVFFGLTPFRDFYIGQLVLNRGLTQPAVIFLATLVFAITVIKWTKLNRESRALRKSWIPEQMVLADSSWNQITALQQTLANERSIIATRCNRVLNAYRLSGDRKTAAEVALDDSAFYSSASESSYSLPRILVWAIPLLGFIGTVIGISQAVTGFSGFLEEAGQIDQIKEGIGVVTGGLATAFDTTLLALLLSVVVMIPLVLVERYEAQVLLRIDIYINDRLLPRLKVARPEVVSDGAKPEVLQAVLEETLEARLPKPDELQTLINATLDDRLPNREALVEPAQLYAKEAAQLFTSSFITEIQRLQSSGEALITRIEQVSENAQRDREQFLETLAQQQQNTASLSQEVSQIVAEVKAGYQAIAMDFASQSERISDQLNQAADTLAQRVSGLEKATSRLHEFAKLQNSMDRSLLALERASMVERSLTELRETLSELQPMLKEMRKPRKVMFVEQQIADE
ncbi:MAG: MotA/TolQ/ExbB proton channel family protein [Cyanobacteria bacterium P01_H01_bin.15]